jgi:hypothetical protein
MVYDGIWVEFSGIQLEFVCEFKHLSVHNKRASNGSDISVFGEVYDGELEPKSRRDGFKGKDVWKWY